MARWKLAVATLALVLAFGILAARNALHAQAAARADTGEAAVAALVSEVRSLRTDLATASRNQLRAQMLLGRVQMQEQRLAYLDKQRADTAAMLAVQSQMASAFNQGGTDSNACAGMPSAEARRDCEANVTQMRRRLADQQAREDQLRSQQRDLENALSAEQARWSEFNSRLDELERALR
jgi:hypothetical protein